MKKFLLFAAAASLALTAHADFESATDAVNHMGLGWNLGNGLDCHSGNIQGMSIESSGNTTPTAYETAWGQPVITRNLIRMCKEAGITAIRVPVTWYPHMGNFAETIHDGVWDKDSWTGYDVDPAWMARVKEVVDYVIDEGLYCILNVHHDTGPANTAWIEGSMENYNAQKDRFIGLWTQIANTFKDYDEKLLFEGYNEILDPKKSWCFAGKDYDYGYDDNAGQSAYDAINHYAQDFVNTVRGTGDNNATRNLIVCTYAACCAMDYDDWGGGRLLKPVSEMVLPTDLNTSGHLIYEVHYYPQTSTGKNPHWNAQRVMAILNQYFTPNAPVIFGEWGQADYDTADNDYNNFVDFAKYFVDLAKKNNMATFMWRELSDEADRAVPQWSDEDLLEAVVKGYYGEEGFMQYGPMGVGVNQITAHDELLTSAHGTNHIAKDSNGDWAANRIELTDAQPYECYYDAFVSTITYTRNYSHTGWQPLYLPYDLPYADWCDVADVAQVNAVHQYDNDDDGEFDEMKIEFKKVTSGTINAHTPYVIKPKSPGEITFESSNRTLKGYKNWQEDGYVDWSSTTLAYKLCGVYQTMASTEGVYAMSGGEFWKGSTSISLLPNRIYMTITPRNTAYGNGAPTPQNIKVVIVGEDDEEDITGLFEITTTPEADTYYDLLGRPVNNPAQGLYIKNGKKVYVK